MPSHLHLATIALLASTGFAVAADIDAMPPRNAPFDGSYVGLQAGVGVLESDFVSNARILPDGGESHSGGVFGAHAGYGVSFGRIYLGGELEVQGLAMNARAAADSVTRRSGRDTGGCSDATGECDDATSGFTGYILTATEQFSHDVKENGALKARLGYDLGGIMPFATAGLAVGRVETSYLLRADIEQRIDGQVVGSLATQASDEGTSAAFGYTVGGGVEVALEHGFSVRGEYGFTDLGETTYTMPFYDGRVSRAAFETMLHQAKLGVSYHF